MSTLVFLLEEESAKNMLRPVVKELVPEDMPVQYITFSGKQDLERQLVKKIRFWRDPGSRFIILRDKDSGDCGVIKQHLLALAQESGKGDAALYASPVMNWKASFWGIWPLWLRDWVFPLWPKNRPKSRIAHRMPSPMLRKS